MDELYPVRYKDANGVWHKLPGIKGEKGDTGATGATGPQGPQGPAGTTVFDELTQRPSYNGSAMTHNTSIPEVKTAAWDAKIGTSDYNPESKTSAMTQPVGKDSSGKLWTAPGGGGGTSDFEQLSNRPKYNSSTMTGSTNIPQVKTATWDAKYDKPASGIPSTDMTSAVQTSLGKADSALQEHQSLSAYRKASAQDDIDATKAAAADLTAHTGNTANPHNVTAEQTAYNSAASSHTAGSVAAQLSEHSGQIVTLQTDLTNKAATSSDIGKVPIVTGVTNGKISSWGFGTGARKIYGFHIDSSDSNPSDAVTYLEDAVGMTPAAMNFTTGVFSYGSWKNAFFMPRPCMLKYDGTVDYYLNENDYTKKEDGVTASDVADVSYGGNAMMEWGQNGKRIWYKIVPDADPTSASIYIADNKYDDGFRAWSFINANNQMVDHFYTPIYNGTLDGSGRLRSISGLTSASYCQSKNATQEIAAAELNNPSTNKLWYTEQWSDIFLMNMLLILIGKSLNTQGVFGNGRISQASAITSCLDTGTMNDKGLFYGSNGNNDGVKVFGMENYWGNHWRRFAGMIMVDFVQKYKMTRGTADGSTATDYNTTGNNYLVGGIAPQTNNYISKHEFDENGMYVNTASGSSSTYYCDYFWQNSGTSYAYRGGNCFRDAYCGAFYLNLSATPSYAYWGIGAAPSCKPLF